MDLHHMTREVQYVERESGLLLLTSCSWFFPNLSRARAEGMLKDEVEHPTHYPPTHTHTLPSHPHPHITLPPTPTHYPPIHTHTLPSHSHPHITLPPTPTHYPPTHTHTLPSHPHPHITLPPTPTHYPPTHTHTLPSHSHPSILVAWLIFAEPPPQGKEGCFVVRNSSRENMYTLSIW